MKYQYWKAKNGAWAWHLISSGKFASNRQVVAHGEGYAKKADVLRAIDLERQSRPAELTIGQSRRYRFSFAALLALSVAIGCLWLATFEWIHRWSDSFVATDATVLHTHRSGKRRDHSSMTKVRFAVPDGRVFTPMIHNVDVEGDTTIQIRYNPLDPNEVSLADSGANEIRFSLAMLIAMIVFLRLAYMASLHDGEDHFA